jgi:transposase
MRKIKEVLRLKHEAGCGNRDISKSCGIGRTTVSRYLRRAARAGLSWPLPPWIDETQLERLLFPPAPLPPTGARPEPDWSQVHQELKRKGVTLALLWEEYKAVHVLGYQYSWFCEQYREWSGKLGLVMRQDHRAGEKMFVDYAGHTVDVVNPLTGEVQAAQVFVAVLGASNYTFAEGTWTQALPDWIGSHQRAFQFFGGVTELVVIDNLKSGVSKACRYEPDINPTYQEMAAHYGTAVLPARVRKPRDKAKAEVGVQLVERWILAALRKRTFFSLAELNRAIRELLDKLNNRPFKKLAGSRRSLYESLDKPALRPLPATAYQYAQWKKAKVHIDYHVEVDRNYYSVPHQMVGKKLDIRYTERTVECFFKGQRVASHRRSTRHGGFTTLIEHMPRSHQEHAKWTPERITNWLNNIGEATAKLAEEIMGRRAHPQQGFRACLGLVSLAEKHGEARVEAACSRALAYGAFSSKSVERIIGKELDKAPLPPPASESSPILHANIRGASYFLTAPGGSHAD